MRSLLIVLLYFLAFSISYGSDDTTGYSFYELNFKGEHIYHDQINGGNIWDHPIELPEVIKLRRQQLINNFNGNTVSDSPLYHGATYTILDGIFRPVQGIRVWASVIGEHRGLSYGVFAKRHFWFIPQVNIVLDTSFLLLGEKLRARILVGNERDKKLYEGLTVYNVETQGSEFFLQYGNFRLTYHKVGDMVFGYGLNINDIDNLIASVEDMTIYDSIKTDIRIGSTGYSRDGDANYNYSAAVYNPNIRLYAQYATRTHSALNPSPQIESSAYVIGASADYTDNPNLRINGTIEYRTYNNYFNMGYYSSVSPANFQDESDYIYPVYLFNRPFSQWAVFTEYPDKQQSCFTFRANAVWKFYSSFILKLDLDMNSVSSTTSTAFMYPFYQVGVGWEPITGIQLMYSITNKGMDLNTHYPGAFYLYKDPMMQLTFEWDFRLK